MSALELSVFPLDLSPCPFQCSTSNSCAQLIMTSAHNPFREAVLRDPKRFRNPREFVR